MHYIINKLAKRMTLKDSWLITLKSLMVYHRLMREVDASFLDELLRFQARLFVGGRTTFKISCLQLCNDTMSFNTRCTCKQHRHLCCCTSRRVVVSFGPHMRSVFAFDIRRYQPPIFVLHGDRRSNSLQTDVKT